MVMYDSSVVRTLPPVGSSLWHGGPPLTKVWDDEEEEEEVVEVDEDEDELICLIKTDG